MFDALVRSRRVRDVAHRSHSADFVCDSAAGPVYVEVKDYASSVPSAEVEKFLRDLRVRGAAAGVLLSLSSPIVGQRESVTLVLDPQVETGTLVPVVYAAPSRGQAAGGRLHGDVAVAAVDMATCFAEAYPRGVRGLHGRDTALAYAAAADQLADGAYSLRADLADLGAKLYGTLSGYGDRLASLGREARQLAQGQRSEAEDVREVAAGGLLAALRARYEVRAPDALLARVVAAVEALALGAGVQGERNRWRFLKTRAVHNLSGCGLSFTKGATETRVPLALLTVDRLSDAIARHPKKIRVGDGELTLELDDSTVATTLALVGSG